MVIPAGCLEKMVEYMESHPKIGVLGPRMLSPDGGVGASVMRLPTVWNTLLLRLGIAYDISGIGAVAGFLMAGYPYDSIEDVEMLTGWFWLIPRTALNTVGGLMSGFSCTARISTGVTGSAMRGGAGGLLF